jgi:hypothetical protein
VKNKSTEVHEFLKSSHSYVSGIMQQDNTEQVIIDPKLIAHHYIRTWFFLDLLSSIPLDYIFLIFSSISGSEVSQSVELSGHFGNFGGQIFKQKSY